MAALKKNLWAGRAAGWPTVSNPGNFRTVGGHRATRHRVSCFLCALPLALPGVMLHHVRVRIPVRGMEKGRTAWLTAEGDTPSLAAALVKLCSRATARKTWMSLILIFGIYESFSKPNADYTV